MPQQDSPGVERTLAEAEIHDQWIADYRTPDNQAFFERVFDELRPYFAGEEDRPVLDAGCGTGSQTLRLASRGKSVIGTDVSLRVLRTARASIDAHGLGNRVQLSAGNLLALPFPDGTFPTVLCWGVLMHMPDVAGGVRELCRVLAPNGHLIVSEANAASAQARAFRAARRWLKRERADVRYTPSGVENWKTLDSGPLVTREADVGWLVEEFARNGLVLMERRAGQLTELYTRTRARAMRTAIHALNRVWFERIRLPGPAFGNLLILRKTSMASG